MMVMRSRKVKRKRNLSLGDIIALLRYVYAITSLISFFLFVYRTLRNEVGIYI